MKTYFDQKIIDKAIMHARSKLPEESCGFIVDDDYIPMKNRARDKIQNFSIDPKQYIIYNEKIRAIVHSHDNYPHASKDDMIHQLESGVPWGIINFFNGHFTEIFFWGDTLEVQDLVGRPFNHGVHDCFSLVRDYYRLKGFTLPISPRENHWWKTEPSMLMKGYEELKCFKRVDPSEAKEGDIVLMIILAEVANHSGIYLGDGRILHHLYGRLSREESIYTWRKYIYGYYRVVGEKYA